MLTIDGVYENLLEINKSKFYSFAYPVSSEEECKGILQEFRKKYKDATHICFAYILSSPSIERASDDGEPQGTAGRPILEVLKKKGLTNIIVLVIRYFGGIKLGAGGLIRAYTDGCKEVVDKCNIIELIHKHTYKVILNYDEYSKFLSRAKTLGITIKDTNFENGVEVVIESEKSLDELNALGYGEFVCQ
ncbi:MAG: YigZ family protein [Clostridiales bacterium]|nr:YigZ family protein [Clostridiales bacterium]